MQKILLIIFLLAFGPMLKAQDAKIFKGTTGDIADATGLEPPVTEFTCNVTGVGLISANLFKSLTFSITHAFTGDLLINLISPEGTVVVISNNRGGAENFTRTTITQNSTDPFLVDGDNPYTGTFQADDGLTGGIEVFTGEDADGTWTLQIVDNVPLDAGKLEQWTLQFGGTVLDPNIQAPLADFQSEIDSFTVSFIDLSTNDPTSWTWNFGDGNTSNEQNPVHTYTLADSFNVSLIVSNGAGADTIERLVVIENSVIDTTQAPVADFIFTTDSASLTVNFIDQSINTPIQWQWEFGDGSTSISQNPSHTYAENKLYEVCLTVTNTAGTNKICKEVKPKLGIGIQQFLMSPIKIAPNPSNNFIQISSPFDRMNLLVTDLTGKQILHAPTFSNHSKLDISDWQSGAYFGVDLSTGTHFKFYKQ